MTRRLTLRDADEAAHAYAVAAEAWHREHSRPLIDLLRYHSLNTPTTPRVLDEP